MAGSPSPARRPAMTPIWRRKRRGGGAAWCCSSPATRPQAEAFAAAVAFFAPGSAAAAFPAWDCLPYDRVSPKPDIESARLATLAALAQGIDGPAVIVTSVSARCCSACRRAPPSRRPALPPRSAKRWTARRWSRSWPAMAMSAPARCAIRAISPCAAASSICGRRATEEPLRLDFFGETLDAIRRFDAETQLSDDSVDAIALLPASEAPLEPKRHQPLPHRLCRRLRRRRATIRCMKASAPAARRRAWSIGCRCSMTGWTRCSIICRAALVMLGHQVEEAKSGAAGADRRMLRHPRAVPASGARQAKPSRRRPTSR